ncbi:hypothetical protein HELRODRAFT_169747 [Helobdella robusta]|uniref:Uncharacterized protein n=1 Tax=Helobdella robusta TaxID=6412 RepID=T1F2A6_HELRO|nr:hypothetical protein HELRODRAFT_169747 [Helobdella robusta]ESO08025.1 hypothetical protein HELRODRAFT_169747 [Helobdella robusta]
MSNNFNIPMQMVSKRKKTLVFKPLEKMPLNSTEHIKVRSENMLSNASYNSRINKNNNHRQPSFNVEKNQSPFMSGQMIRPHLESEQKMYPGIPVQSNLNAPPTTQLDFYGTKRSNKLFDPVSRKTVDYNECNEYNNNNLGHQSLQSHKFQRSHQPNCHPKKEAQLYNHSKNAWKPVDKQEEKKNFGGQLAAPGRPAYKGNTVNNCGHSSTGCHATKIQQLYATHFRPAAKQQSEHAATQQQHFENFYQGNQTMSQQHHQVVPPMTQDMLNHLQQQLQQQPLKHDKHRKTTKQNLTETPTDKNSNATDGKKVNDENEKNKKLMKIFQQIFDKYEDKKAEVKNDLLNEFKATLCIDTIESKSSSSSSSSSSTSSAASDETSNTSSNDSSSSRSLKGKEMKKKNGTKSKKHERTHSKSHHFFKGSSKKHSDQEQQLLHLLADEDPKPCVRYRKLSEVNAEEAKPSQQPNRDKLKPDLSSPDSLQWNKATIKKLKRAVDDLFDKILDEDSGRNVENGKKDQTFQSHSRKNTNLNNNNNNNNLLKNNKNNNCSSNNNDNSNNNNNCEKVSATDESKNDDDDDEDDVDDDVHKYDDKHKKIERKDDSSKRQDIASPRVQILTPKNQNNSNNNNNNSNNNNGSNNVDNIYDIINNHIIISNSNKCQHEKTIADKNTEENRCDPKYRNGSCRRRSESLKRQQKQQHHGHHQHLHTHPNQQQQQQQLQQQKLNRELFPIADEVGDKSNATLPDCLTDDAYSESPKNFIIFDRSGLYDGGMLRRYLEQ